MKKLNEIKKSIIHLKVHELKKLFEDALKECGSQINSSIENLLKPDDSIIELNQDDLRNLILNAYSSNMQLSNKEIKETSKDENQLISRIEMARELKISLPTLRKWTVNKIIPQPTKLGGSVLYNKLKVLTFIYNLNL